MTHELTRVMIVDDEDIFRNNLRSMLDWNKHGYNICAEARSGREAVQLLEKYAPDIVITDIHMPEFDGLSLIAHLTEKYPTVQTIALSGFDEYDYVRSSLKSGVLDYLLKHKITPDNLLVVLNDARERASVLRTQLRVTEISTEQVQLGLTELRRVLFRDIIGGNIKSDAELIQRSRAVGMDISSGCYIIVVAELDQDNIHIARYSSAEWMALFNQIVGMVERQSGDVSEAENLKGLVLPQSENRFIVMYTMPKGFSHMRFHSFVNSCIQNIRTAMKSHYNMTACYSVSPLVSDIKEIPSKLERAMSKLGDSIFRGQDMVIREDEESAISKTQDVVIFEIDDELRLRALLRDGFIDELKLHVGQMFDKWRTANIDPGRLRMIFTEMLSILSRMARQNHIDSHELLPEKDVYEKVSRMKLNEMEHYFLEGCEIYIRLSRSDSGAPINELTKRACAFIKRNYSKPISLVDVADDINITSSYLSRVFKSDMGKSVVEYINDARIDAAKRLIREGSQPKDLVAQLGFNSASYFITVFRKATGKTPMQYKYSMIEDI